MPSIEQVMPWLHLVFDAWEEHRQTRAREALQREQDEREQQALAALAAKVLAEQDAALEPSGDDELSEDSDAAPEKKKKRKHRKDKK
jgi:hypothetical protein